MKIQKTFSIWIVLLFIPLFCGTSFGPVTRTTYVQKVEKAGPLLQAIQTVDGNFVSLHRNHGNLLVRKIRVSGEKIWERVLHLNLDFETEDNLQYRKAIAQTSDGGYILVGRLEGVVFDYYDDSYKYAKGILIKLGSDGKVIWNKVYYESDLSSFYFSSVISTPDGGFLTAGGGTSVYSRQVPFQLVKFNSSGEIVWARTLIDFQTGFKYQLLSNNNTGFTLLSGSLLTGSTVTVIRLDHLGKILWKRSLEMEQFRMEVAAGTNDQGLMITGHHGTDGLSVVRLDKDGRIVWKKTYQLSFSAIRDLIQTADSKYAVLGAEGGGSIFLLIDSSGKIDFQVGSKSGGGDTSGSKIFNPSGGGYLILKASGIDLIISRTDSQGMVPGCNLFEPGSVVSLPFGEFRLRQADIKGVSVQPSLKIQNMTVTSVVSNLPVSNICP